MRITKHVSETETRKTEPLRGKGGDETERATRCVRVYADGVRKRACGCTPLSPTQGGGEGDRIAHRISYPCPSRKTPPPFSKLLPPPLPAPTSRTGFQSSMRDTEKGTRRECGDRARAQATRSPISKRNEQNDEKSTPTPGNNAPTSKREGESRDTDRQQHQ